MIDPEPIERWRRGDLVERREVLDLSPLPPVDPRPGWSGSAWLTVPVFVVDDSAAELVCYLPPGAPFVFPTGEWPTPTGRHPWDGRGGWTGHGCLMVHRPGDHHAVWHFWTGPERTFAGWYINLQTAFVRDRLGFSTQDLELDIVIEPDGTWHLKDLDLLPQRVAEGRYGQELIEWVVGYGDELARRIDAGDWWWDRSWAAWSPPAAWDDHFSGTSPNSHARAEHGVD